jgi:hypothetical protein
VHPPGTRNLAWSKYLLPSKVLPPLTLDSLVLLLISCAACLVLSYAPIPPQALATWHTASTCCHVSLCAEGTEPQGNSAAAAHTAQIHLRHLTTLCRSACCFGILSRTTIVNPGTRNLAWSKYLLLSESLRPSHSTSHCCS